MIHPLVGRTWRHPLRRRPMPWFRVFVVLVAGVMIGMLLATLLTAQTAADTGQTVATVQQAQAEDKAVQDCRTRFSASVTDWRAQADGYRAQVEVPAVAGQRTRKLTPEQIDGLVGLFERANRRYQKANDAYQQLIAQQGHRATFRRLCKQGPP